MAVEVAHLLVQVIQIQEAVDAPKEMVGRELRLEIELVEQPGLDLLPSKHRTAHYTTQCWLRAAGWIQLDDSDQGNVRCFTTPSPPSRIFCVQIST
ncbi:hypothetical protein JSE7799_01261 [Jannaschia seosinensis]|uniref:Uncharacterized protein n=1 Tax=Jannaschia seosinensis TaxID=313367 RepID=A0A0M7BBA6_9RHOB|nr:hypothetical protein JSE7799_01261 [Jannaschia seosinensis]